MGAGIVTQPSVPAILRDLRKRIRILEARPPTQIPEHIVYFVKDPQNDDWLGVHVTGSQAFTLDGIVPIQVGGFDVIGGIGLTSDADIWIGTTDPGGGTAGDVNIATSTGGDVIIQTGVNDQVTIIGGGGVSMVGGFAGFSANDVSGAGIFVDDRAGGRPQDILAEVLYDGYTRTPKITLRTDIFGDSTSFNEVVVYGGFGGGGPYTQPGVYVNLSDDGIGVAAKFEIRDELGAPVFAISRISGGSWTYHIKTGATWLADL